MSTSSLNTLLASVTCAQLMLLQFSNELTIEIPELSQISMAQAFNQSLNFLSSKAIKCDLNSNQSSLCSDTLTPFTGDSSRWYPPPPPLPPRLLECSPSFKTDCNVTDGGSGGGGEGGGGGDRGDSGKIIQDFDMSLGILVAIVSIFGILIVSSVAGFLLKRKNRARISADNCCSSASRPETPVSHSAAAAAAAAAAHTTTSATTARATSTPTRAISSQNARPLPTGSYSDAPTTPSPRIKEKMTSIVAMARSKCVDSSGSWNCCIQQDRETNNNDAKYYDNHALHDC